MLVVPYYLELVSDEQLQRVEKALREMNACFFTDDKIEGMELAEVQRLVEGAKSLDI